MFAGLTRFPQRQILRVGHSASLSHSIAFSAQLVATPEWSGCFYKLVSKVLWLSKAWDILTTFSLQQKLPLYTKGGPMCPLSLQSSWVFFFCIKRAHYYLLHLLHTHGWQYTLYLVVYEVRGFHSMSSLPLWNWTYSWPVGKCDKN